MERRDRLAVADLSRRDASGKVVRRADLDLDPLVGLEASLAERERSGDEDLHEFVGEARCGEERAERLDRTGGVAGLLGQFPRRGFDRRFAGRDAARAELDEPVLEGCAVIADQHEPTVVEHRYHRDRATVANGDLLDRHPAATGPSDQVDVEDRTFMQTDDLLRVAHRGDHTEMPEASAHPAAATVEVRGLRKAFGKLEVLRGIDLVFRPGETTVVLGPSGTGKSVLLKLLVGLLRPDAGEVWFDGERIDRFGEAKLGPIRRRIGYLFQQGALFDSLSVFENVAFPMREAGEQREPVIARAVRTALRLVGLEELVERMPSQLSGGQQKRVALARAIVLRPELVLYDEPTTGLDPIRADLINELILRLQKSLRVTGIVVTHDLASAFKVADRMIMLFEGQVVLDGTPDAFRESDHPIVGRFLRGEASAEDLASISIEESPELANRRDS
jgi:phospholipid/cholesterol/gamma-HCH transport system ATP-binding protein